MKYQNRFMDIQATLRVLESPVDYRDLNASTRSITKRIVVPSNMEQYYQTLVGPSENVVIQKASMAVYRNDTSLCERI